MMNKKQCIAYIQKAAKSAGLTFRVQKNIRIGGAPAYCFTVRGGGAAVMSNCTLGGALENVESGYIASFDAKTNMFKGC